MRVILHIGTEKTGTTSIQMYLYKNRQQLRKAGYHLLQSGGKYNSRALPAACIADDKPDDYWRDLGVTTAEERHAHRQALIQDITDELAKLPADIHTVLISSEHFHSRIRTEEEMDNVQRLLSRFFDEFKIICYLREQVSTCYSWYSTGIKSGGTHSFASHMKRCRPSSHYFNYYDMLAKWEQSFGSETLDVGLFPRNHLLNGDLLDDFTQRIDPRLVGTLSKAIEVENESLTPVGQALTRAINLTFPVNSPNPDAIHIRNKCKRFLITRFRGSGQTPTLETRQKLFEAFVASNEQLRQKFFPEVETLFEPPAELTPPGEDLEDSFVPSFYFILDLLKKEIGGAVQTRDILRFSEMAAICINDLQQDEEEPSHSNAVSSVIFDDNIARMLRNSAIKLEQVDVAQAVPLMELARKIDPSLRKVEQRLEKYRELLQQKAGARFMIEVNSGHPPKDPQELNTLRKKYSKWQSQLSTPPPQAHMPVTSKSLVVRSDGTVSNEGEESVMLYVIIEADSMAEALEAAKKCPSLEVGGSVRVSRLFTLKEQ